jgi:hypothetical protein
LMHWHGGRRAAVTTHERIHLTTHTTGHILGYCSVGFQIAVLILGYFCFGFQIAVVFSWHALAVLRSGSVRFGFYIHTSLWSCICGFIMVPPRPAPIPNYGKQTIKNKRGGLSCAAASCVCW